jgi:biotin operon repressor
MPKPIEEIEVKDHRRKSFYIADNRIIADAGPIIGVYGGAVYNSLLYHANNERKTWPSVNLIAKEWGISRRAVIQSIQKLESLNIISIDRNQGTHNVYRLIDPSEWRLSTSDSQSPVEQVTSAPHAPVEQVTSAPHAPVEQVTSAPHAPVPVHHMHPNYTHLNKTKSISRSNDDFNAEKKPPKKPKIGVQINYLEEINKHLSKYDQETQLTIKLFLDGIANKNKSGDMTQSRYLNLLCELSTIEATTSTEYFRDALSKAIKAGAGNLNYVRAVIKSIAEKNSQDKNIQQPGINLYSGKKYIVYGGRKEIQKTMIGIRPEEVVVFLGLPELECILSNGVSLESKGLRPKDYETIRPTDEMFEKIYQDIEKNRR